MSDKWVAGWMGEKSKGVERETFPMLNVIKEFLTKFCQQRSEYRTGE